MAPHPDDEVLGCGGTIARLTNKGVKVHVIVMTKGTSPRFDSKLVENIRAETLRAHKMLGIERTHFLDLPAAEMDKLAQADVNAVLGNCIDQIQPDLLFVPFVGDIHVDHQITFGAAMVWARPRNGNAPHAVLAYETLSETNWFAPGITPAFTPNCYINIDGYLDKKIAAFECFESQIFPFPDERSIETIRALAMVRGATVNYKSAEAFVAVRILF